ncbi:MAG: hypothetical protein HZB62_15130 [Nitrospirae bacterium]|nr:hypothetical protein [Nitrospirota bacterium]
MENASPKEDIKKKTQVFAIEVLAILAWVNLIAGVIGAFILWDKSGSGDNTLLLGLSFAVGLQGLFGFVFLLVVVSIAENLIAIRNAVETKKD